MKINITDGVVQRNILVSIKMLSFKSVVYLFPFFSFLFSSWSQLKGKTNWESWRGALLLIERLFLSEPSQLSSSIMGRWAGNRHRGEMTWTLKPILKNMLIIHNHQIVIQCSWQSKTAIIARHTQQGVFSLSKSHQTQSQMSLFSLCLTYRHYPLCPLEAIQAINPFFGLEHDHIHLTFDHK